MSNKPNPSADAGHGKSCPICNPKRSQKHRVLKLGRKMTRIRLRDETKKATGNL